MELNPAISIIIPVYNVEKYLNTCVDSILSQKFDNWELLLINDGSSDSSGTICDEYANNDSRIKVFHKKNEGVGSARNLGIKMMKGKYVWFVDADDLILPDSLNILYTYSEKNNLDCVQFAYYNFVSHEDNIYAAINYTTRVYSCLADFSLNYVYSFEIWKIFIKRDVIILNSILFSENIKYAEDQEFVLKVLAYSKKIATMNKVMYGYRQQREGQAMANIRICNIADNLEVAYNLLQLYAKSPLFTNDFILMSVNRIIKNYFHFIAKSKCNLFDILELWDRYRFFYKNSYFPIYKSQKKNSITLYLCYWFPFIYIYIIRILKRK